MTTPSSPTTVAIAGRHLAKRFGHVNALVDANVTVHSGEVVALFGDNGAGKSTFVKSLLGVIRPDSGTVVIGGSDVELNGVSASQRLGVECVYQDLALAPDLSVVDNMFLGHETVSGGAIRPLGLLSTRAMEERAVEALSDLSIKLPSVRVAVRDLSGGQRQAVAVAKAVMWASTAVLMDEPTAALGARQSEIVCELITRVAERGLGVLVVSHDLPRVLRIADRVTILWRGRTNFERPADGLTVPQVVAAMVGYSDGEVA